MSLFQENIFLKTKLLHKLVTFVFITAYGLLRFSPDGRDIFLLAETVEKRRRNKNPCPKRIASWGNVLSSERTRKVRANLD